MEAKKHRLVIAGSLGEFVALTQLCKVTRGYETIVCDGYPDGRCEKDCGSCLYHQYS